MKLIRISIIALSLIGLFFTSCRKNDPVMLIVDAGPAQSIQLPVDTTVTLSGIVKSGQTASMQYAWILISGPNNPTIANNNSSTTAVNNLVAGTYIFQFQATNSDGLTAVDTTSVLVHPIVTVDAGSDASVQLPTDTITLSGIVKSGQTPSMVYSWKVISGPSVPAIVNSNSSSTLVNNLVAGTYVFQFQATNNSGQTGVDTTSILVIPAKAKTVTFQPTNGPDPFIFGVQGCTVGNPYMDQSNANDQGQDFPIDAWTFNGVGCSTGQHRGLLKFADLDTIPASATILSAQLYLYGIDSSIDQNYNSYYPGSPYYSYGSNEVLLQRITGQWDPATVTWNTQPAATAQDEVVIPASTSKWNYSVSLDVTSLVNDMRAVPSGNKGFLMLLQTEVYYRALTFASSRYPDASKHPKLVVTYQ
jgi:hypothetical protein